MKVCFISKNINKKKEIEIFFKEGGITIDVVVPQDLGFGDFYIKEDGNSFWENALIKAKHFIDLSYDIPIFAEDSGLVVDALGGEPGIYSARYGGEELSHKERCFIILGKLKNEQNRKARFISAIAFINKGVAYLTDGKVEGEILREYSQGRYGFGYDPIFKSEDGKLFSHIPPKEKNKVSHRGRALLNLVQLLKRIGVYTQ